MSEQSISTLNAGYIGRFAPSPTGCLHQGSLVAALGSYLRAKVVGGQWLVRMEDLDPPREESGAASHILNTLEAHGLYWDGKVLYQSQRHQAYQEVIDDWLYKGLVYRCRCSRKGLIRTAKRGKYGIIYPDNCRHSGYDNSARNAIRLKTHNHMMMFDDGLLGHYQQKLHSEVGDFIVKRSDGLFSYQLAVGVDDHFQKINEVVRGEDLLWNTPRQLYIQQLLGFEAPTYYHLPLVLDKRGDKLSKQTFAPILNDQSITENLVNALAFLGFGTHLINSNEMSISEWLDWALKQMTLEQSVLVANANDSKNADSLNDKNGIE